MSYSMNLNGRLIDFSEPKVMGILNVTPDSFYHGSRSFDADNIAAHVEKMLQEGVDIIDVGGFSTRPHFVHVSADEELCRVDRALNIIRRMSDIPVSLDTFRSTVVQSIIENYGDFIVNDISGGKFDPTLIETVGKYKLPYLLMLNSSSLDTMFQSHGVSITDHIRHLSSTINTLKSHAIQDIIIDPGFGFYKSIDENYHYLRTLSTFSIFDYPILMGVSRKSMIWKVLNISPLGSLNGTTAIHTFGLLSGVALLRVHDVAAAKEVIALHRLLKKSE